VGSCYEDRVRVDARRRGVQQRRARVARTRWSLCLGASVSLSPSRLRLSRQVRWRPAGLMMVALLLYAYARGIASSRVIERTCIEDVAFRVIAAQQRPDHATIARLLERHQDALAGLFAVLTRRAGTSCHRTRRGGAKPWAGRPHCVPGVRGRATDRRPRGRRGRGRKPSRCGKRRHRPGQTRSCPAPPAGTASYSGPNMKW
jgi:hypothetical protein